MFEIQDTTSTLYIPDNIKTGFEVWGLGLKEIAITAIAVGIAFIASLIIGGLVDVDSFMLPGLGIMIITGATAAVALKKNENNLSMVDHIRLLSRFAKEQQKFKYKYYDQYSSE